MDQGLSKMRNACVAGILIHDLKILLAKRSASRSFYPNVWDLPGGHLEAGESPEAALVRELKEELGIVATAFESLGTFQALSPEGYGSYKYHVYLVTRWRGTVANRQLEEHSEIRWVTFEDIGNLDLADPQYAQLFQHALQRFKKAMKCNFVISSVISRRT